MPINPNIAMGYRPIQLENPPNPMNAMVQMSQIQNYQQTNQLNQMKMEEARRGMQEDEAVRNYFAQNPDRTAPTFGQGLYGVSPKQGMAFGEYQDKRKKARLDFTKTEGDIAKGKLAERKTQGDIDKQFREGMEAAARAMSYDPSDAQIRGQLKTALSNQNYTPEQKAMLEIEANKFLAIPYEQRRAVMAQQGASASDLKPMTVAPGSSVFENGKFTTAPERTDTDLIRNFNAAVDGGFRGNLVEYQAEIARAGRTPAATVLKDPKQIAFDQFRKENPNATSAELYAAITDSQEKPRKPLTELQLNKLRTDMGKDHSTAVTMLSQMEDVLDSARAVRTSKGLGAATGYSGAYLPSWTGSDAAFADTRIANLRGKITAMGKAAAAMSGAIGPMAVQEWKILADQVAVIDLVKGKGPLLEQVNLLEAQAEGAIQRIRDKYETVRGEDFDRFPQFNKLPAPKVRTGNPRVATGVVNTAPASGNPHAGKTDAQIRKELGF